MKQLRVYAELYGFGVIGVLHAGGHVGQEWAEYLDAGAERVAFFEPDPDTYIKLCALPRSAKTHLYLVNAALGSKQGKSTMYVSDNGGLSSSLLEPREHLRVSPVRFPSTIDVDVTTVDAWIDSRTSPAEQTFNVLNLDVQGYELEVLKGATSALLDVDAVRTEVNTVEMYKGCALVSDLDSFLGGKGFTRVETELYDGDTWGDALYVRKT